MAEYLDKEAFKKSVEERYCNPCKAEGKDHNCCRCRVCWVDDMLDEVECFQPADVAPVVHGRWIMHDDEFGLTCECSACHIETMGDGNYCPNCGAKMDGGAEDASV